MSGLFSGASSGVQCSVTSVGALWCWGDNLHGQLGKGNANTSPTPIQVIGQTSGCLVTSAGNGFNLLLKTGGQVLAAGLNNLGQLGNGGTTQSIVFVQVTGLTSGVIQIQAGIVFSCAFKATGAVVCWGSDNYSNLGDGGSSGYSTTPVSVTGFSTSGALRLVSGFYSMCLIKSSDSTMSCWGKGWYGETGYPYYTMVYTMYSNAFGDITATEGSGGSYFICIRKTTDEVVCVGYDNYGQLGAGTLPPAGYYTTPLTVLLPSVSPTKIPTIAPTTPTTIIPTKSPIKMPTKSPTTAIPTTTPTTAIPTKSPTTPTATPTASPTLSFPAFNTLYSGIGHSCALQSDGNGYCWGMNNWYQLDTGTITNAFTPVLFGGGSLSIKMFSLAGYNTCILKTDGTVWCVGRNTHGESGSGPTQRLTRTLTQTSMSSAVGLFAGGGDHVQWSITSSGALWCWGANTNGQLGTGTTPFDGSVSYTDYALAPVQNPYQTTDCLSACSGLFFSLLLKTGGQVLASGLNNQGQLGNGGITPTITHVQVSGLTSGVVQIQAGQSFACALKNTGAVVCWGSDAYGFLGYDGSSVYSSIPVSVIGYESSGAARLVSAFYSMCLIKSSDSTVSCWGNAIDGSTGSGTNAQVYSPIDNAFGGITATEGSGGSYFACMRKTSGEIVCTGEDNYGELGAGTSPPVGYSFTPLTVMAPTRLPTLPTPLPTTSPTTPTTMRPSGVPTVPTTLNPTAPTFLSPTLQPTAHPTAYPSTSPTITIPSFNTMQSGVGHTCAVQADGNGYCWGLNNHYQLNTGDTTNALAPVLFGGGSIKMFALSVMSTCILKTDGTVWCLGWNVNGECGVGSTAQVSVLSQVQKGVTYYTTAPITDMAAVFGGGSEYVQCAVSKFNGDMSCWGSNQNGQLGFYSSFSPTFNNAIIVVSGCISASAGYGFMVYLLGSGEVMTCGNNDFGKLGNGGVTPSLALVQVTGISKGAVQIQAARRFACALMMVGSVVCWGSDTYGSLGDGGSSGYSTTPVGVIGYENFGAARLTSGFYSMCLIRSVDSKVVCWGNAAYGATGSGSSTQVYTPINNAFGGITAIEGTVGSYFACMRRTTGDIVCTGMDKYGQLGSSAVVGYSYTPLVVVTPTQLPTTLIPTVQPTLTPTKPPTTLSPTLLPTLHPTTYAPTKPLTLLPTNQPTLLPTLQPTTLPTYSPSSSPTNSPTSSPTNEPTTIAPTMLGDTPHPTFSPTVHPTKSPTSLPTTKPTKLPSFLPSKSPTRLPSKLPTKMPTNLPTKMPTTIPPTHLGDTDHPSSSPTRQYIIPPSSSPTVSSSPKMVSTLVYLVVVGIVLVIIF